MARFEAITSPTSHLFANNHSSQTLKSTAAWPQLIAKAVERGNRPNHSPCLGVREHGWAGPAPESKLEIQGQPTKIYSPNSLNTVNRNLNRYLNGKLADIKNSRKTVIVIWHAYPEY